MPKISLTHTFNRCDLILRYLHIKLPTESLTNLGELNQPIGSILTTQFLSKPSNKNLTQFQFPQVLIPHLKQSPIQPSNPLFLKIHVPDHRKMPNLLKQSFHLINTFKLFRYVVELSHETYPVELQIELVETPYLLAQNVGDGWV